MYSVIGVYCLWILAHPVKRSGFIADFQEYVRGRVPRYGHPINDNPENDESRCENDPVATVGNGYDTYGDWR